LHVRLGQCPSTTDTHPESPILPLPSLCSRLTAVEWINITQSIIGVSVRVCVTVCVGILLCLCVCVHACMYAFMCKVCHGYNLFACMILYMILWVWGFKTIRSTKIMIMRGGEREEARITHTKDISHGSCLDVDDAQ
jgi:hypothetical protein